MFFAAATSDQALIESIGMLLPAMATIAAVKAVLIGEAFVLD